MDKTSINPRFQLMKYQIMEFCSILEFQNSFIPKPIVEAE